MPQKFQRGNENKLVWGIGVIILLVYLFVAIPYVYWQDAQDTRAEKEAAETTGTSDTADSSVSGEKIDLNTVQFVGSTATEENPWGTTAGLIQIEDVGECIFLTPNTSAEIELENPEGKSIAFKYEIYSQVRDASDGADIFVEVFVNGEEEASISKMFAVTAESDWAEAVVPVDEEGVENIRVKISCRNGEQGNDDADWVLINRARFVN